MFNRSERLAEIAGKSKNAAVLATDWLRAAASKAGQRLRRLNMKRLRRLNISVEAFAFHDPVDFATRICLF